MAVWLEYYPKRVKLHSGGYSHWLVRGDLLFDDWEARGSVLDCWEKAVSKYAMQTGMRHRPRFYGIPEGGTLWAKAITVRTKGVYLEKYAGGAFVVDDVCTTGASLEPYQYTPKLVAVIRVHEGGEYVPVLASWMTIELDYVKEDE